MPYEANWTNYKRLGWVSQGFCVSGYHFIFPFPIFRKKLIKFPNYFSFLHWIFHFRDVRAPTKVTTIKLTLLEAAYLSEGPSNGYAGYSTRLTRSSSSLGKCTWVGRSRSSNRSSDVARHLRFHVYLDECIFIHVDPDDSANASAEVTNTVQQ